jgi:AraC family transcriptional regulator of adaptative response / DNA-3-methyladenine glycosylase II
MSENRQTSRWASAIVIGVKLTGAVCYRAVLARDARYDGRFFTCVKTTGIYCRPICPARPPKLENCRFVPTAAAAQEAGFRPCLRCRPESSPDLDAWRGPSSTVSRALKLIDAGALDDGDVSALAERLELGPRQLRRLFRIHLGAAPVTVAQTRRVLLARQLIDQTNLSMIQIALASGFGSVRRFNEIFQQLYRRPPGDLRRRRSAATSPPQLSLLLPYRSPYDWDAMLRFLSRRAIQGLELVTPDSYSRVIELDDTRGTIHVSHAPQTSSLRVVVRFPQLAAVPAIIARLRRMFDLGAEPAAIAAVLSADPMLAPLVAQRPGLRVPGGWDPFEIAVRAILGQQISVKAATRLASRLVDRLGESIDEDPEAPGLTCAFPQPQRLTAAALSGIGLTRARAAALVGLARAARTDPRLFDPCRDLDQATERLRRLNGVGEWTANYIAMRALGESDAFPAGDAALPDSIASRAQAWRPWRAYGVMQLWTTGAATTNSSKEKPHAIAI